jgi:hypothetical protein
MSPTIDKDSSVLKVNKRTNIAIIKGRMMKNKLDQEKFKFKFAVVFLLKKLDLNLSNKQPKINNKTIAYRLNCDKKNKEE